jgi:hypothetical protein
MRYGWKVVLGLWTVLALSTAVSAQRTTGGITGTVKDGTGAVLPGVTVDLAGEYVMGAQTSITNENGVYRFLNLSPGTYNLAFTITGFAPFNRNGLVVAVGMTTEENVTLQLTSVSESITVTGASPVVDTIASDVGTNYDKEWVTNAPIARNSFHDFIASAPGVVASSRAPASAMVYGSAIDDNSYQLDGTDVTDAFFGQALATPNTDAIEEIEILSLGAPAEYGSVQGAVFNVVTKQGSNTFHGDANFYYQNDALTDKNTTEEDDDGFPFYRDSSPEITGQLGGPITKDKLWFFGSFQYQRDATAPVGVDPTIGSTTDERKRFMGKINYQINPQHRIVGTYHQDRITDDYPISPNDTPETYRSKKNNTPTPGVGYTGLFGTNTVFDARYSGFYGDVDLGPALPEYSRTATQFYNLDTGGNSGAINYFYILDVSKTTVNGKLSHFADNFLGGSHDFKFGVQYGHAASGGVYGYNDFVLYYGEGDSRYGYGYEYQPFSYGGNTRSLGIFADDTFQVNDRLTLNLGIRFDTSKAYSPEQPGLNEDLTETGETFPSQDHFTWNTVSPRLGFNVKLTGDGRTVFKGHWGRYHRTITTGDFSNIVGPSIPPIYYGTNFNFATDEFETLELLRDPSENLLLDSNMKSPYTDQFILSVDRELTTDLGLSLIYVNKRGRDFAAWQDLTGVYQEVPYVDNVGTEATGQTITVFKLVSDIADRSFLMTNSDQVFNDVNAFTVQVNKRMSSNWQLTSALTYMKSEGRSSFSNSGAINQRSGLQFNSFGQNPNDFVNTESLLPGDRPWTFKNQLVYQFPFDFLIGLNYQYSDGAPRVRRVAINSVTGISTRILTSPRPDEGRFPSQNLVDLRVQKDFVLDDRGTRIGLFLDALNLLNDDAHEQVLSSIATSSSYKLPTNFVFPRRFQVGVKFTF